MKQIDGIEVAGYDGPNYKTLLASGSWRVAFPGARCLIVENVDTSPSNSEYCEVV